MKESTPPSILWISDIHFRENYHKNKNDYSDSLTPFLESFFKVVQTQNEKRKIQTVLLTGDLAFEASKGDYDALHSLLIRRLTDILGEEIKFISIPGNHDVERNGVEAIFDRIREDEKKQVSGTKDTKLKSVFKNYATKTELLTHYNSNYYQLFKNYSNYVEKAKFNLRLFSDSPEKSGLFGYISDPKNKIIYFLFNTAWFCLSASIKTMGKGNLLNQITDLPSSANRHKEKIKTEIDRLFDLYTYTNENGGQLIGANLIVDINNFKNQVTSLEYHEYTKIVLLHHPFSWLSWEEMYTFESKEETLLRTIIKNSDLVLTGHEHVPDYILPNLILNHCWHIPAGMFLDDDIDKKKSKIENFPHNRFSILDLYPDKAEEIRFLYESNSNEWIIGQTTQDLVFRRKYKNIFGENTILQKAIDAYLRKTDFVINFFNENKGIVLDKIKDFHSHDNDDITIIDAYIESHSNSFWIIIRPKTMGYYQNELTQFDKKKNTHHLDTKIINLLNRLKKGSNKQVNVAFLTLDLLVAPEIYKNTKKDSHDKVRKELSGKREADLHYTEEDSHDEVRKKLFGKIAREADLHFDRYRHLFFNRITNLPFDKISAINFVNIVIPYWKVD